jgi:hypothetical protein
MIPALEILTGEWEAYLERIYGIFHDSLIGTTAYLEGKPVHCRYHPATDNKHCSFWHCISEGPTEDERTPDPRRCERIGWVAWMIAEASAGSNAEVIYWRNYNRGKRRLVILHKTERFVVIVNESSKNFMLVTCFLASEGKTARLLVEFEAQKD